MHGMILRVRGIREFRRFAFSRLVALESANHHRPFSRKEVVEVT